VAVKIGQRRGIRINEDSVERLLERVHSDMAVLEREQ